MVSSRFTCHSHTLVQVVIKLLLVVCLQNGGNLSHAFTFTHSSTRSSLYSLPSVSNKLDLKRNVSASRTSSSTTIRRPGLSMVLERLSDEAVAAVQSSHQIGREFGLRFLKNEVLTVGLTLHPEKSGRALATYNFIYPLVKLSASKVLSNNGFNINRKINKDTMKLQGEDKSSLPFSEEVKLTLTQASKIADFFQSTKIHSEHVLLALLGYNFGNPIDLEKPSSSFQVLINTEDAATEGLKIYDFCEQIVADMKSNDYDYRRDNTVATKYQNELVVIGGGSSTANTLSQVGVDMTQLALAGKYDLVFGRDKEIVMALRTLGRRRKNNPCLIGDPGVGKTAIAEALAQVLASSYPKQEQSNKFRNPFSKDSDNASSEEDNNTDFSYLPSCPKSLAGYRLINLNLASLVAGTRNRGDFEEKVQKLIDEASNSNVILFIDEIHNLIGTGGGGDGAMNAANLLKPALSRGDLKILGATTTPEYRRYIEKDAALERRFQPLEVKEPTVEETLEILKTISPKYAEYHEVEYTSNALEAAAKLSDRYISDRFLPDKAIDLLDEAGSMVKMAPDSEENNFVTEDSITQVIAEITGIPVGRLDVNEKSRLRDLEQEIGKRVKGQERAIRAVAKSIRRARSGMRDTKRPVASFLFCGPTGVGKTELCKALADTYFGREKDLISIDMSEYMDRFSTSRLVGAPPGYVGYEEGGQLTEAVRRNPHSVVLLDEVEKAHEDVLNILLQIMDEGKLTDGKGRVVNFKNTIFVMTSNIGSQKILDIAKNKSETTIDAVEQSVEMARVVKEELETSWKPELLNRIDEIVIFSPLSDENLLDITINILNQTAQRAVDAQNIKLTVDDNVVDAVAKEGAELSSVYGARPIKRASQRYLEDTLSEAIMSNFVEAGDDVIIEMAKVSEINGVAIPDGQQVVEISKTTNYGRRKSILVPVEEEAGIGSAISSEWRALYGNLPSLKNPTKENDASWE